MLTTKLAIEKHRSDQLLFGSLEQLSVPDLLQTAEAGRRTGTVSFQHDGFEGHCLAARRFRDRCRGRRGESEARRRCTPSPCGRTGHSRPNFGDLDREERFRVPPSSLLLEAMRRFDEESASRHDDPGDDGTRAGAGVGIRLRDSRFVAGCSQCRRIVRSQPFAPHLDPAAFRGDFGRSSWTNIPSSAFSM